MDFHENDTVSMYLSDLELLKKIKTKKQMVELYCHKELGKVLIINGEIQHIENYQCLYHEMLVHLPIAFLSVPKTALIIGGGSLFAAQEILKYSTIEKLTLCDYDPKLINLLSKYYPHINSVMNDPRFQYIDLNAKKFISEDKNKYDLIVNDCFNLIKEVSSDNICYIDALYNRLNYNGVCSDIIYRYIFDKDTMIPTLEKIHEFKNKCYSLVTVPEYPGVLHLEIIWGKNAHINQKADKSINDEQFEIKDFQYYNPNRLTHHLYLPKYLNNILTI